MQKFIAKYGLAAHLAILAVAPLFLFPFFGEDAAFAVLLWLFLVAGIWTFLGPSVRAEERLSDARRRVLLQVGRDPLLWVMAAVVLLAAVRLVNDGIALSYDAEVSHWRISNALFPLLPGSTVGSAKLPFAAALSSAVLIVGCRHSLGRSARMAFLLISSSLAGLASVTAHLAIRYSLCDARPFLDLSGTAFSFAGFAYGIYMLVGTVALVAVFVNNWKRSLLLPILAIGGCGAGLFSFSPVYVSLPFAAAEFLLLIYALVFTKGVLRASDGFRFFVIGLISLAFVGLLAASTLPEKVLDERLAFFSNGALFPKGFWNVRALLSDMAFKSWTGHLWIGTGLGSFPLDFRFRASPAIWGEMPMGAQAVSNGWWWILSERGVVGLTAFLLPIGFLLVTYLRRFYESLSNWRKPHPACVLAPLVVISFCAMSFLGSSPMRAESLMVTGAVLAVAAASFPKRK